MLSILYLNPLAKMMHDKLKIILVSIDITFISLDSKMQDGWASLTSPMLFLSMMSEETNMVYPFNKNHLDLLRWFW